MSAEPRSRAERRRDTERRLRRDVDVWVASASAEAAPYLAPLSFDWDSKALLMATLIESPTGRNLAATRTVRLGLGHTRDVAMIDGEVEVLEIDALPQERVIGSSRAPASIRVSWARPTAGSGFRRAASRPGGRRTSCPTAS
jgi:hypothetical protein